MISLLNQSMSRVDIENWLRETNTNKLRILWRAANNTRLEHIGNIVHLRGLLEISNYCRRKCTYCGINITQKTISRYRMNELEIMNSIHEIAKLQYGTVVIQSGEDYGLSKKFISNLIKKIKKETLLAVTLSLGERTYEDLEEWKIAGADRYLLRFETSNKKLYKLIHPALDVNESLIHRFRILKQLRILNYEVGSGVMVGIPGQTYQCLANDIGLFRKLNLDMIGIGPYISSPKTTLGAGLISIPNVGSNQVPPTELMTYKVIALSRLVCPQANIPSTSALASINRISGYKLGLKRGANIVMPNMTPIQYRKKYTIYPNKNSINETPSISAAKMRSYIMSLKREIGFGPGGRKAI